MVLTDTEEIEHRFGVAHTGERGTGRGLLGTTHCRAVISIDPLHRTFKGVASKGTVGEPLEILWNCVEGDKKTGEEEDWNASRRSQKHRHLQRHGLYR